MARPGTDPTCFRPEITSKEVGLLVAVLQRAIDDLGDPDDVVAFEAHEFFLQPGGRGRSPAVISWTLWGSTRKPYSPD